MGQRKDSNDGEGESALFLDAIVLGLGSAPAVGPSRNVCVFGTDLCSMAGDVLADASDEMSDTPIMCIHDNRVPGWVDEGTLAVIIARSGEDASVKEVLEQLRNRGCKIVIIASEVSLSSVGCETIVMSEGMSGSQALGFSIGALTALIRSAGIFDASDALVEAIGSARNGLDDLSGSAMYLAKSIGSGVPAFYSTSDIHACSHVTRELVSSVGGRLSFTGELPEFDHNELVGWSDPNTHAPELAMTVFRGESRSELVNTIVGCMLQVLEENGRLVKAVEVGAGTSLSRNVRGIVIGIELSRIMGGGDE